MDSGQDTKDSTLRAQGSSANLSVLKVDRLEEKFKEPESTNYVGPVVLYKPLLLFAACDISYHTEHSPQHKRARPRAH